MSALSNAQPQPKRHSILDLAPLELHCMNALWALGEGSVRDIREALVPSLPRAYTTIMTIMDRLARKGVVERVKVGRAYVYRPSLSADDARSHAVEQVVEHFFAGSAPALHEHLTGGHESHPAPRKQPVKPAAEPATRRAEVKQAVEPDTGKQGPPLDAVLL